MQQRRPNSGGPVVPRNLPILPRPTGSGAFPSNALDLLETLARRRTRQQDHERAMEALFRDVARRSLTAAPPTLTSAVRESLSRTSIAPAPPHTSVYALVLIRLAALAHVSSRMLAHYHDLSERQRRLALRSAGTLMVAILCGLGFALDPGEGVAALGIASAVVLSFLAVVHLLSTAVGALMSSAVVAVIILALYASLALLWIRLVRRPLEA